MTTPINGIEAAASSLAKELYERYPQQRTDGRPYLEHVTRVARSWRLPYEEQRAAAWLHDTLEDMPEPEAIAREIEQRCGTAVLRLVRLLTHHRGENYFTYLSRIAEDAVAVNVKVADILDNMTDAPSAAQVDKYAIALDMLGIPPPRVVCAAHRSPDRSQIALCIRHVDAFARRACQDPPMRVWEQGFVDQYSNFLTREAAWKIAKLNGQIRTRCGGDKSDGGTLYSENLY